MHINLADCLLKVQTAKQQGNDLFRAKKLIPALRKYYEGIMLLRSVLSAELEDSIASSFASNREKMGDEYKSKFKTLNVSISSNMCAIFVKQKKWQKVLKFGGEALKNDENNVKLRYRVGLAYCELSKYEKAWQMVEKFTGLNDSMIDALLKRIRKCRSKANKQFYGKFSKMFSEGQKDSDQYGVIN